MRKLSQKNIIYSLFGLSLTACVLLSSCLELPNLDDFMGDETVQEKIASTRVDLDPASEPGLIVGNGRISGLNPDKYYWAEKTVKKVEVTASGAELIIKDNIKSSIAGEVEAEDDEDYSKDYRFVTGNGKLVKDPSEINRVSGRVISDLSNYLTQETVDKDGEKVTKNVYTTYTIRSAAALPTNDFVYYRAKKGEAFDPEKGDSFTTPTPSPGEDTHYLNLNSKANLFESDVYEVFKIYVSPPAEPRKMTFPDNGVIELEGEGITTDYLFIEYRDPEKHDVERIRVLRVVISGKTPDEPPKKDDDMFKVTFEIPDLGKKFNIDSEEFDMDNSSVTINQSILQGDGLTITITCDYPNFNSNTIKWWYNESPVISTPSGVLFIHESENIYYLVPGTHLFTVEAKINNVLFTQTFKIVVQL